SIYGHIAKLAESVKVEIETADGTFPIFQIPETLPQEVLTKMHAPAKSDHPIIDANKLATFDAFIMGIPTRYGNYPGQWKAFWDTTGGLWGKGALAGKYAGGFVSTAGPGGGQEVTIQNAISTLTHHGVIFVPLGYTHAFGQITNLREVHGGAGARTYTALTAPTALELEIATIQGKAFWGVVSKVKF
ncbi:flavoprotein-like protein, partial [Mycena albidolilacea]